MYYDHGLVKSKLQTIFIYENKFNNFEEITKEEVEQIRKKMQERKASARSKGEWITNLVRIILDNRPGLKIDSFDKKMIYLIEGLDPYCYTNKKFQEMNRPCNKARMKELESLKGLAKETAVQEERERLKEYKGDIEEKIGIFEQKLIKYESIYLRHLSKLGLEYKSIDDIMGLLTLDIKSINFNSIPAERYRDINLDTKEKIAYSPKSLSSTLESINYKTKKLEERIIEMICSIDSDLDFLKVFFEKAKWEDIFAEVRSQKNLQVYTQTEKEIFKKIVKLENMLNNQYQITKNNNWTL